QIQFNIAGNGVQTIQPLSVYLITGLVEIDGYSQPGSHANFLANTNTALPLIEIDGSKTANFVGFQTSGSASVTYKGLIINRFPNASIYHGSSGTLTVSGCFLGTDASGASGYPSVYQVQVNAGSTDRKSTRLNSSHRTISYAVFCLK